MAINEYYTGDGGDDDLGNGTSHATRWLTIAKALATMTTGQPTRLNIYGLTTAEGGWDVTTRWTGNTTPSNFLLFQGYGATAGDGTVATIDGGNAEIINDDNVDALMFRHLKFKNWGAGTAFSLDNDCSFIECEFDGEGSRASVVDADTTLTFVRNKVHSIALSGTLLNFASSSTILANYIQIVSATAADTIIATFTGCTVSRNVISLKTTENTIGIGVAGDSVVVENNTIFNQSAGTGSGISTSAQSQNIVILNNILCGFSGAGGKPLSIDAGSVIVLLGGNNAWNNTTTIADSLVGTVIANLGGNEELGANPFTSTGNADHSNDDWTIKASCRHAAYPTELYDPDNAFSTRNANSGDCGALQHIAPTLPAEEDVETGVQYGYVDDAQTGTLAAGGGGGGPVFGDRTGGIR